MSIKSNKGDKVFLVFLYSFLVIITLIVVYPLIYIVSCSFSEPQAIISGKVWFFPVGFYLDGYKTVLTSSKILSGYGNTIFYTVVGTTINVFITVIAAFALVKKDLPGKKFLIILFTFTMMFNGGLIPTYLVVKKVGILDTRWAMLLPNALGIYQLIVARTFFMNSIPNELYESSQLDGCSDINYLVKIVLPLSKALIAVLTLFYAVGHWNAFFNALIYLNNPSKYPLQIILRDILIQNTFDLTDVNSADDMVATDNLQEVLKYTVIIVASLPILMVYPFVQKHFVQGVMVGSLKG